MRARTADAVKPSLKFIRDLAIFVIAIPTLLLFPGLDVLFKREWEDRWFRKV